MEVRKGAHGVWQLQYHVVWVTKYRRRILKPFVVEYLKKVLPKLLRSMPGGRCQTKANGPPKIAGRPASTSKLTPLGEGGGAIELEILAAVEMAFLVEVVIN